MTNSDISFAGHVSVYPGEYEPLPWREKEVKDELIKKGARVLHPPVNISEMPDHYRVEMAVPGFSREDFFIDTNGSILTITGMIKKPVKEEEEHYRLQGFTCECIKREIVLPWNVDTDFATAEYRNGILCICLFKNNNPLEGRPGHIIVY